MTLLARPLIRKSLGLAALVLLLDQLHKWYMIHAFDIAGRGPIEVAPFLDLVMVWNYGISFGMFAQESAINTAFLILVAVAVMALLVRWLLKTDSRWAALGIGLVLGGATGNVIDRLVYGAVADFFSFHLGSYYWPAFNLADSAICVGVALLCIESMLMPEKDGSPKT